MRDRGLCPDFSLAFYREQAVADVFLNQGAHAIRIAGDVGVSECGDDFGRKGGLGRGDQGEQLDALSRADGLFVGYVLEVPVDYPEAHLPEQATW